MYFGKKIFRYSTPNKALYVHSKYQITLLNDQNMTIWKNQNVVVKQSQMHQLKFVNLEKDWIVIFLSVHTQKIILQPSIFTYIFFNS